MQTFEKYLLAQGFSKVDAIEFLKITLNAKNDLRYFFDGKSLGLHISGTAISKIEWNRLIRYGIAPYLKVLYLSSNSITNLNLNGGEFSQLRFINLSLSKNLEQLIFINLDYLEELTTNHCPQLEEIELIGNFPSLKKLDISYCFIEHIALPKQLSALWYFNFSKNRINNTSFLKFITKNTQLRIDYLFWEENPLPETLINTLTRGDIDVLKTYFGEDEEELIPIFRKKLILLGNTQAGKTSVCDILLNQNWANGESTHGVNIFRYSPEHQEDKEVLVQIFDFGGQDFYHNTHLAFYSQNANYLLVYGNGQKDEYGSILAQKQEREDDTFPLIYWLDSVRHNLQVTTSDETALSQLYENHNIRIGLWENTKTGATPKRLNQERFETEYRATEFWYNNLRQQRSEPLQPSDAQKIKDTLDKWLMEGIREDFLSARVKSIGDRIVNENQENAIVSINKLKEDNELTDNELKLLHDSYYIQWKENATALVLKENAIVNQALFSQWIYAILNLDNLFGNGYFSETEAKEWLKLRGFAPAIASLDYILAFLVEEKMIFKIEENGNYIVPQYRPTPSKDTTESLIDCFDTPFVKYEFTGFYHTQLLTGIVANFFEYIVKEKIGNVYFHQIWKNKVIIDLNLQEKKNINYYLLVSFSVEEQKPILSLSAINIDYLQNSKLNYTEVISFIEEMYLHKHGVKYTKHIKACDGQFVDFKLFANKYYNTKKEETYQFIDPKTGQSYDKRSDFPLFEYLLEIEHQPSNPQKMKPRKPCIYFSYAWGDNKEIGESREIIVDELYDSLEQDGYLLKRDKQDLGYKGIISEFMKEIGKGDIIVVVISDKYLRSSYCMFELYEAFRDSRLEQEAFVQKLFPIRVEALKLSRPEVQEEYFDYWENEEKAWEKLITRRSTKITAKQQKQYENIKAIHAQLGNLLGILSDINSLSKELLAKDNFDIIKKAIDQRIQELC
jgi:GTPase SAR1 family protein